MKDVQNVCNIQSDVKKKGGLNHERQIPDTACRTLCKQGNAVHFSPDMKFKTWRRLWIALAETEKELGLDITDEQIAELKAHKDDINYEDAKKREKEVRHDVMSHVYAYGLQCPKERALSTQAQLHVMQAITPTLLL